MIESIQPVLMSQNVLRAIRFYEKLGFILTFSDSTDNPKYAGVARDGIELHIQWHDPKEWDFPNDRPTYRFVVTDVALLHEEFVKAGVERIKSPVETAWGTFEFHVLDEDRNGLQFYRDLADT